MEHNFSANYTGFALGQLHVFQGNNSHLVKGEPWPVV